MADGNLTLEQYKNLGEAERAARYAELSEHDRFVARCAQDPGAIGILCNGCAHYRGFAKCAAYPDGIPGAHMDELEQNPAAECGRGMRYQPHE